MAELKEGDMAPLFTLPDDEGKPFSLADVRGTSNVILYFYPKDDSPGCRAEAQAFREEVRDFFGFDAVIVGVSAGTVQAKADFKRKYGLNFKLLADLDRTVSAQYGALGLLGFAPKRTTFVIGKDGAIKKIHSGSLPLAHVEAAKEALFRLQEEEKRSPGAAAAPPP